MGDWAVSLFNEIYIKWHMNTLVEVSATTWKMWNEVKVEDDSFISYPSCEFLCNLQPGNFMCYYYRIK